MGTSQIEEKIEGWLYVISSNRFGLQSSSKRYFILEDHHFKCYKSIPNSQNEPPVKSTTVDSCIRVADDGRESIHRKVFFTFTLYNSSNHSDQIKLGASSPEVAARWIHFFQEAVTKVCPIGGSSGLGCPHNAWQCFRLSSSKRIHHSSSTSWVTASSSQMDFITTDVVAPSSWRIFGCQNGLRVFKEAKDGDFHGKQWDDHPAIMAVGVVDGTSENIFRAVMSLGPSRSQWDYSFYRGSVVENLDGHTDIIHKQLCAYWLPWGVQQRDLLLRRYWRRDDDGTYVILYHSVYHKKCLPQKGYIRACLKSGGYVITPLNHGKQSVVKHMLAIDWKLWAAYMLPSLARSTTIRMLGKIAALRELFKAKAGDCFSSNSFGDQPFGHASQNENKPEIYPHAVDGKENLEEKELEKLSEHGSLAELNDVSDEFFDAPEGSDFDPPDYGWPSDCGPETNLQDARSKRSTAAVFVKKLHGLAVHKKGYVDLVEIAAKEGISCCYGTTLAKDPTCTVASSWTTTDPSTFLIRGKTYLMDSQKIKANHTLMKMVAADWITSDRREDDLGGRPGSIVQNYAAKGGSEFFFIVNIQVPGSKTYNLALYYMTSNLEDAPLLQNFVDRDDAYRNSRFKLIPYISKGPWIVKQSVGKKACLAGQALEINYFCGENYIELGIDIGSSTVARGVVSLVLGYLNNLVIEMAFLIQANTEEELPEQLLGTCRLNHLDASKAVPMTL
ncbi:protein ENHANCED DISEASE RESISTANCE 2-like isoform X1 [Beta vulgaris subsp. vulgaris]|uniref:protein ENHANCED DISEASE RESISTANCE 2-like isoform X1 n=1 Tax=Beta vulgaris subsp. vulgaris TaxID=3555 RepID=UPI002036711B|nr:protein ENHANCED DISEASE RESISTANCE 2-like isoform X1 [Beta vulgaris subsp. vulgaris]